MNNLTSSSPDPAPIAPHRMSYSTGRSTPGSHVRPFDDGGASTRPSSSGTVNTTTTATTTTTTSSTTGGVRQARPPQRDIVHFATLLGRQWACSSPGHEICFLDESGLHVHLSDEQIMAWVTAWYNGFATVMMPPLGLLPTNEDVGPRLDKKAKIVLRPTDPRAITPLPHFPELGDSLSQLTVDIIQPYVHTEATTSAPNFGPSSSSYTVSSQGDIPRHNKSDKSTSDISEDSRQGKQSTSILTRASSAPELSLMQVEKPILIENTRTKNKRNWLGATLLIQRGKGHLTRLKKRQRSRRKLDDTDRRDILHITSYALEMAKTCYPLRAHKIAHEISRELQRWLQSFEGDELTTSLENLNTLLMVQICSLPVLLRRISEADKGAAILASGLITALTEPASAGQERMMPSVPMTGRTSTMSLSFRSSISSAKTLVPDGVLTPNLSSTLMASLTVCIVAQELGSETPLCEEQHSWLGVHLLRIVEMTLKLRRTENIGLTQPELDAIAKISERRQRRLEESTKGKMDLPLKLIRPYEVALLAISASSASPKSLPSSFTLSVLGQTGLPLLLEALNHLINPQVDTEKVAWADIALIIRALAFLSEHGWVVRGLSFHMNDERLMIVTLLSVFRKPIPERWFSIRFWAMDTVRNMVGQRPGKELVKVLVEEDAVSAFESLFDKNHAGLLVGKDRQNILTAKQARPSPDDIENIGLRLRQEYQKAAAERAEELVAYIKIWEKVVDEYEEETLRKNRPLTVVSLGGY